MEHITHLSQRPSQRDRGLAFVALFAALFLAFWAIAFTAQVLMLDWRSWFPGAESSRTLTGGVRAAVYSLMSYLT
ncbi:MAG: hypothetical protein EBQ76_02210 [Betaproteobacteria bacterium]|nr:hypothetical protein [Betaproteobacteria bacterium]NBY13569.1 hypothetical protein [Betaproteobacteria bacterium]